MLPRTAPAAHATCCSAESNVCTVVGMSRCECLLGVIGRRAAAGLAGVVVAGGSVLGSFWNAAPQSASCLPILQAVCTGAATPFVLRLCAAHMRRQNTATATLKGVSMACAAESRQRSGCGTQASPTHPCAGYCRDKCVIVRSKAGLSTAPASLCAGFSTAHTKRTACSC